MVTKKITLNEVKALVKQLVKEDINNNFKELTKDNVDDFLNNLSPQDKDSVKNLIVDWYKWNPQTHTVKFDRLIPVESKMSDGTFEKKVGNVILKSKDKSIIFKRNIIEINNISYQLTGYTMEEIKNRFFK